MSQLNKKKSPTFIIQFAISISTIILIYIHIYQYNSIIQYNTLLTYILQYNKQSIQTILHYICSLSIYNPIEIPIYIFTTRQLLFVLTDRHFLIPYPLHYSQFVPTPYQICTNPYLSQIYHEILVSTQNPVSKPFFVYKTI